MTSEKDDTVVVDNPIRIGMQGSLVDERHECSRRYPKALMSKRRVRVEGFSVALDVQLTRDPEAAARGRRLFESVCDAIEDVVRRVDADDRLRTVDDYLSHEDSNSSVGGTPKRTAPAGSSDPAGPDGGDHR